MNEFMSSRMCLYCKYDCDINMFVLKFKLLWLVGLDVSRKRDRQSLNNEEISFQDLVCDITTGQKQKDVTLPFYFICLLHLANEKVCPAPSYPVLSSPSYSSLLKIQSLIFNY